MTTINVTELDIKTGRKLDCNYCPVAIAISRVLKLKFKVIVLPSRVKVVDPNFNTVLSYTPSWEVKGFILDFDKDNQVNPIDFSMDIPDYLLCTDNT